MVYVQTATYDMKLLTDSDNISVMTSSTHCHSVGISIIGHIHLVNTIRCSIEKFLQNTKPVVAKMFCYFHTNLFSSTCAIPFEKQQAHTQNRTQAELAYNLVVRNN